MPTPESQSDQDREHASGYGGAEGDVTEDTPPQEQQQPHLQRPVPNHTEGERELSDDEPRHDWPPESERGIAR